MQDSKVINNIDGNKTDNGFKKYLNLAFSPKNNLFEIKTLKKATLIMMFVLLAVQLASFLIAGSYSITSIIGVITGLVTIVNLILVDQGRLTNFSWGAISAGVWLITDLQNHLIGDTYSQVFYFVMQFVGIYVWGKDIQNKENSIEIKPKKMTILQGLFWFIASIVLYGIVLYTSKKLNGTQIYLDATLLPLGIVGQVLMTYGYRSQWVAWIALDVINIIVWFNQLTIASPASLSMLVLQVTMTINAIYGANMWFKENK